MTEEEIRKIVREEVENALQKVVREYTVEKELHHDFDGRPYWWPVNPRARSIR
jgi:hypothetical protein